MENVFSMLNNSFDDFVHLVYSYRKHSDVNQIIKCLLQQINDNANGGANGDTNGCVSNGGDTNDVFKLKCWIAQCPQDFKSHIQALCELQISKTIQNEIKLLLLRGLYAQPQPISSRKIELIKTTQEAELLSNNCFKLLNIDITPVFSYIVWNTLAVYTRLVPEELFDGLWQKNVEKAKNVVLLQKMSTEISNWVVTLLLFAESLDHQMIILERLISLAHKLYIYGDLQDCGAILAGLNMQIISRMKYLFCETNEKFEMLDDLFSVNDNFASYRKYMETNSRSRLVPYFPVHLRDILTSSTSLENMDIEKVIIEGKSIHGLLHFQYLHRTIENEHATFVEKYINHISLSEDELWDISSKWIKANHTNQMDTKTTNSIKLKKIRKSIMSCDSGFEEDLKVLKVLRKSSKLKKTTNSTSSLRRFQKIVVHKQGSKKKHKSVPGNMGVTSKKLSKTLPTPFPTSLLVKSAQKSVEKSPQKSPRKTITWKIVKCNAKNDSNIKIITISNVNDFSSVIMISCIKHSKEKCMCDDWCEIFEESIKTKLKAKLNPITVLASSMKKLNDLIMTSGKNSNWGCSISCILWNYVENTEKLCFYSANVGNCSIVFKLNGKETIISDYHDCSNEQEILNAKNRGAAIINGKISGICNITRCLGWKQAKKYLVSHPKLVEKTIAMRDGNLQITLNGPPRYNKMKRVYPENSEKCIIGFKCVS